MDMFMGRWVLVCSCHLSTNCAMQSITSGLGGMKIQAVHKGGVQLSAWTWKVPEIMTKVRKESMKFGWLRNVGNVLRGKERWEVRQYTRKWNTATFRVLAETRMITVKALENGVQICFRPCRGHGMRAAMHQYVIQQRRLSWRHEKVKESPNRCVKFAERYTEDWFSNRCVREED